MNTWWIPDQKQYKAETKRWYCSNCDKRTPIERNPKWDGSFNGNNPAPEWFVRCFCCKKEHWQSDGYQCPACGWDGAHSSDYVGDEKPEGLIEITNSRCVNTMDYSGYDWDEKWKCPKCKTIFEFTNGSY